MKARIAFCGIVSFVAGCGDDAPHETPPGCGLHTNYAGDDACLPAPAGANETQVHFGPKDYDDPAALAPYLIAPGEDHVYCVDVPIDASAHFIAGYAASVRPGNHHLTLMVRGSGKPDLSYKPCNNLPGTAILPLQRDGVEHDIGTGPEYSGGAIRVPANATSWLLDVHYLDATDAPLLMEGWIDLKLSDAPRVVMGLFTFSGGTQMSVQPATTSVVSIPATACPPPTDFSIVSLGAHQHSHGARSSVYVAEKGTKTLIYENYDWEHPFGALFDSSTKNDTPDRAGRVSGAVSGVVSVQKTGGISWECEIQNTLSSTIRYGLDVTTNEMCAIAGLYVPPRADGRSWSCTAQ